MRSRKGAELEDEGTAPQGQTSRRRQASYGVSRLPSNPAFVNRSKSRNSSFPIRPLNFIFRRRIAELVAPGGARLLRLARRATASSFIINRIKKTVKCFLLDLKTIPKYPTAVNLGKKSKNLTPKSFKCRTSDRRSEIKFVHCVLMECTQSAQFSE